MNDDMLVRDLMTSEVFALTPGDSIVAVRDLMHDHGVRHIPVVDDQGDLVGLVSHRDLLRNSLIERTDVPDFVETDMLSRLKVEDVMTGSVERIGPDTELREAAEIMFENKFGCLPVTEGQRLIGILTEADFVRLMAVGR